MMLCRNLRLCILPPEQPLVSDTMCTWAQPFTHSLFFPTGQKGSSDTYSQDKLQHTSFCLQLSVTPPVSVTELQYMHNQGKQLFQLRKWSILLKSYKAQWQGHNGSYPEQRWVLTLTEHCQQSTDWQSTVHLLCECLSSQTWFFPWT